MILRMECESNARDRCVHDTEMHWRGRQASVPQPLCSDVTTSAADIERSSLSQHILLCLACVTVGELMRSHMWCLSQPHPNSASGWNLRLHLFPNLLPEEGSTPEGLFACSLCLPFYVHVLSEVKLHWLAVKLLEHGATAHLGAQSSQMSCLHFACPWSTSIQILENNLNNSLIQLSPVRQRRKGSWTSKRNVTQKSTFLRISPKLHVEDSTAKA